MLLKRIISLFLSAVVIVCAFYGCSSKQQEQSLVNLITADSHYENIDESSYRAYEKLCNAVINGESSAKFNISLLDDVNQLFYTAFPLNALVDEIRVEEDKSGVAISYKNDADTHKQLVSEFSGKIENMLEKCKEENANSDRAVFNAYTYVTSNFTVDNSVVTVYDTVIEGRGTSAAINSLFEYLVLLSGGKASHMLNLKGSLTVVSMVEFKGVNYYFDPAREIEKNSGKALVYFAMDQSRVGKYAPGSFTYTNQDNAPKITDREFEKLESSVSFTVGDNEISVNLKDNGQMSITFV